MYFYCHDRQVQKVRQQSNSNLWKQSPTCIEKTEIQIYWTGILPTLPKWFKCRKITAKVNKLKQGDTVDQLPLQPIVSNSGKAKLLSPLIKISQCTVQNTKEFINHIKKQKVPSNYKMISFDVISLFTNVPRDATIYIVLKRIYEWKEINTSFTKQELKVLILLCTKGVQFTLRGESYIQTDGRTRKHFSSNIIKSCYSWKRYVDDTNRFTK